MMKDTDIQNLIDMNYKVLTLLGIATFIISGYKQMAEGKALDQCKWYFKAVEDVVYKNKPLNFDGL